MKIENIDYEISRIDSSLGLRTLIMTDEFTNQSVMGSFQGVEGGSPLPDKDGIRSHFQNTFDNLLAYKEPFVFSSNLLIKRYLGFYNVIHVIRRRDGSIDVQEKGSHRADSHIGIN